MPTEQPPPRKTTPEPTPAEITKDPILFARWLNEYVILGLSFEHDYALQPDSEACTRLGITDAQKLLCTNEYVIMRALAACDFVRHLLSEQHYLVFKAALLPPVVERISRHTPYHHHDDPEQAIDLYLEELKSDDPTGFSLTYLNRVFQGHPRQFDMFAAGIGLIGFNHCKMTIDVILDSYSKLKFGMSYDVFKTFNQFTNKEETEPPSS